MDILCPRCAARVPAADVNLERMVGKCAACDGVFRIEGQLQRSGRARIARPPAITVEGERAQEPGDPTYREGARRRAPGTLRIARRWFNVGAIFTLGFSLVWNAFLVFWYATALSAPGAPWIMLVFPLLHVAVGVGLFYWSIASLLNRTTIVVDGRTLSVRHAPIPWPGGRDLDADRIQQLFVRSSLHRGKHGTRTSYALCANVDGTSVDLVRGMSRLDEARYMEQLIEDHLSIVDDPTADEGP